MASSSQQKTLTLMDSTLSLVLVCLLSQSLLAPVLSRSLADGAGFAERKDYYSPPDPHRNSHGGTPHGSHSHRSGGSPPCTNPPPTGPGGDHGYESPPTTPVVINPPGTVQPAPVNPAPVNPTPTHPSTPMLPDPNSPFSCDYWRTHPTAILTLLGYWCPLSQIFGLPNPNVIGGSNASLMDALSNTNRDGISALYREGTAAYLNSLATQGFYFTSQQVRDALDAAAASGDGTAAVQAEVFRKANEGLLRHH